MENQPQSQPQPQHSKPSPKPGAVAAKIAQIVWVCIVLIVVLLIIRVLLSLIGANQSNDFATFIYNITFLFVEPFRGLLQVSEYHVGVSRLEFETIVAIFVYLLAGWGVTAIVKALRK